MLLGRSVQHARNLPRRLTRGGIGIGIPTREHTGAWSRQQQRLFAGRGGDFFDDYDDDIHATSTGKSYTADDMEFFDELNRADFEDSYDQEQDQDQSDEEEEELKQRQQVRDELDQRKGRGWSDPWEITDEDFMQRRFLDDLPDWTPGLCSRISMERVKIHPGTSTCLLFLCCFVVSLTLPITNHIFIDGIPTLDTLATLPLPPPPAPHPALGGAKEYGKQRKKYIHAIIYDKVVAVTKPRIPAILKLPTWEDKQDAIDELYESVEAQLKEQEDIFGRNPNFGTWVETALEQYLRSVDAENQKGKQDTAKDMSDIGGKPIEGYGQVDENAADVSNAAEEEDAAVMDDENAEPIFMDLFDKEDGPGLIVPKILHPLRPHAHDGPGRMVEEWELSAHKETKRILLRQCTRQIAQALNDNTTSRVYVHGRNGVGKVIDM